MYYKKNTSEVITFRISRDLKRRMDRLRHINWSELLRGYVRKVVEEEEERLRARRDPLRIKRAIEEMDMLASLSSGSGWSGAEEVLRWRRRRYSYSTQA